MALIFLFVRVNSSGILCFQKLIHKHIFYFQKLKIDTKTLLWSAKILHLKGEKIESAIRLHRRERKIHISS